MAQNDKFYRVVLSGGSPSIETMVSLGSGRDVDGGRTKEILVPADGAYRSACCEFVPWDSTGCPTGWYRSVKEAASGQIADINAQVAHLISEREKMTRLISA